MHRLSKISATILGRKVDSESVALEHLEATPDQDYKSGLYETLLCESESPSSASKLNLTDSETEGFERPTSLFIPANVEGLTSDKKTDDEWYEPTSFYPISNGLNYKAAVECASPCEEKAKNDNRDDCLSPILRSESAAEIEVMEESLISLLDDFRSGRMKALSEERLEKMRNARKEMEELSMAHVKLHRLQLLGPSTSDSPNGLDAEYSALFRKLDNFYEAMQRMSFNMPYQLSDSE